MNAQDYDNCPDGGKHSKEWYEDGRCRFCHQPALEDSELGILGAFELTERPERPFK